MEYKETYTKTELDAAIHEALMEVSELFGGYAANDVKGAEHAKSTKLEGMDTWLSGRATGYQLVESHCERMAAIYKGDK
jgi:hypothetical protein